MTAQTLLSIEDAAAGGYEKRERVHAAVSGRSFDRPPVCFWRHFHPNGSGGNIAWDTVNFFARRYDLDIAKIMSDVPYPMPRVAITNPEDWRMVLDWGSADNSFTASYVSAVRQVRAMLGPAYPLVVTVYSPLTWAVLFAQAYPRRETFLEHFAKHPSLVHEAMGNIALNLRRLACACIEAGADGIFLSCHACDCTVPREIYNEVAKPYDLLVLNGAKDGWLNLLHAHSDEPDIRVDDYLDFPVSGLSWADLKTGRSIESVRRVTDKCIIGGWERTGPLLADAAAGEEQLLETWVPQAREAVRQAGNKGIIVAPGCSLPVATTHQALSAFRKAVDRL